MGLLAFSDAMAAGLVDELAIELANVDVSRIED
jgi:hypothetical protein